LNEFTRIQARTSVTQQQIATGKVGNQYADAKEKAGILATAKMRAADIEAYKAATTETLNRLNIQDLHLVQLSDISARLRESMGNALASGHAPALMDEVSNLYEEVVTILNTRVNGQYIYGGSRADQPPVNATSIADLQAAAAVGDVFDNTDLKQSQRVDEAETIETGLTASDIATDLFQMFKDIADFDAGVDGPFAFDMTANQTAFLSTQHAAVPAVQEGINAIAAVNGSRHEQATAVKERHETMTVYFTKFIGDIEDVDVAAAITRLNQDQAAAEAAGRMIVQLNQLSLLNFLG
jgi:flagellar hook-associated protein 3 FlgL